MGKAREKRERERERERKRRQKIQVGLGLVANLWSKERKGEWGAKGLRFKQVNELKEEEAKK